VSDPEDKPGGKRELAQGLRRHGPRCANLGFTIACEVVMKYINQAIDKYWAYAMVPGITHVPNASAWREESFSIRAN